MGRWIEKAPSLGATSIRSLAVYNNKLYGGTGLLGKLYEWSSDQRFLTVIKKVGPV